jgi:hypothetical protein
VPLDDGVAAETDVLFADDAELPDGALVLPKKLVTARLLQLVRRRA